MLKNISEYIIKLYFFDLFVNFLLRFDLLGFCLRNLSIWRTELGNLEIRESCNLESPKSYISACRADSSKVGVLGCLAHRTNTLLLFTYSSSFSLQRLVQLLKHYLLYLMDTSWSNQKIRHWQLLDSKNVN